MKRVRAAVFRGDGTVELRELPAPEPPAGGAVLATVMRTAVALLAGRRVDVAALRGEILPLERIPDAMALLARRVPERDAVRVGLRVAA